MRPSGAHTHDDGGGKAVLVIIGLAVVLALVTAAAKAVAAIPWYVWASLVLVAVAGTGGLVALAVRVHRRDTATLAARAQERRALPAPTQAISAPQAPREALPPVEQHLHFHVNSAAEVAEILARRDGIPLRREVSTD